MSVASVSGSAVAVLGDEAQRDGLDAARRNRRRAVAVDLPRRAQVDHQPQAEHVDEVRHGVVGEVAQVRAPQQLAEAGAAPVAQGQAAGVADVVQPLEPQPAVRLGVLHGVHGLLHGVAHGTTLAAGPASDPIASRDRRTA